ncbi:hypothetical protein FB451DRAFT_1177437 [Mycena latifolia]|nr:hypothetical protein FB451DRAFT_1177437 [Mycena latifolia]
MSPPWWVRHECEEALEIEGALDFVRACIQRSGQRRLSIRLDTRYFAALPVLEGLLKHSARWREVVVINPSISILDRISHFEGNLRQVHKIVMAGYWDTLHLHYPCFPNLIDLTFLDMYLPQADHSHIPWSQLTRYSESSCLWDSSRRLASYRQLTNLAALRLSFDPSQDPENMIPETILFPNLRVVSFRFPPHGHGHISMDAIRFFDMPALEAFSVHCPKGSYAPLGIPRSSPHLKIFRAHMEKYPIANGDMEEILELFPDLTEITLDAPNLISNRTISRLIPYHDRPPLGPKLEMIRLSNRAFINNACKWSTLVEMLRARFKPTVEGISPLRTFEFHPHAWANDELVASSLKTLRKQTRWDIKVGEECKMPQWDDLHFSMA